MNETWKDARRSRHFYRRRRRFENLAKSITVRAANFLVGTLPARYSGQTWPPGFLLSNTIKGLSTELTCLS
jgi:hypothetical protein